MKKSSLVILIAIIFNLSGINIYAQDEETKNENPFSVSCDLMSRYVWRGTDYGSSPSIQPSIEYNIGGFAIGTWGAFTTNLPGVQEVDLYATYTFKEIVSLTVTDYYFPDEINFTRNYFNYRDTATGHIFEAMISFNGTEKIPLSFFIATNFYGADARRINDNGSTGDIQFSSYAELSYAFKNIDVFMGFNLTTPDTDKGETGCYGNCFGIVNLGITANKDIKITDKFKLPLSVSLITNPQAERIFLVAGINL